jgi:hypothetical protein
MVTLLPTGPDVGENPEMARVPPPPPPLETVKSEALVTAPAGSFTLIGPLVAELGTVAVICASESTVKWAFTPLNFTTVTPLNPLPAMVTLVPTGPDVGVNPEIASPPPPPEEVTVNAEELVAVPAPVVTEIGPVEAEAGTVAVIWLSVSTV